MLRTLVTTGLAAGAVMLLVTGCTAGGTTTDVATPDPVGTWGSEAEGQPHLVLDEGGELSGSDGCNRLSGSWEQMDDGKVEFGTVAATLMACPDVDTWLAQLSSATIDGTTMHVQDTAGVEIGTLNKQ